MGDSNAEWGYLAEHSDTLASVWDACAPVPDAGDHPALDAFCESKHITIGDLVRVGARLKDADTLAYAQPSAIAYRSLTTGRRWFEDGSTPYPTVVPARHGSLDATVVIVAEGQTDAARLTGLYPSADVFVLPNGARSFQTEWATLLAGYELVLTALDNDAAGDDGAAKIAEHVPNAVRFAPPAGCNDWCELTTEPPSYEHLDADSDTFLDFWNDDDDDAPMYVVDGLLARGEVVLLAADTGAGKSWMALSLGVSVARGTDWVGRHTEQGTVLYVDEENPSRIPRSRARALGIRHAPDRSVLYASRRGLTLGDGGAGDAWLQAKLDRYRPSLVVIDTAQAATAVGDVNSNSDVARLYRNLRPFAEKYDCCIVILHHERKLRENESRSASQATLGARQWVGQSDSHITLRRIERECTDETDDKGIRRLRTVLEIEYPKLRDDVPPQKGKLAIVSQKDGNYLLTDSAELVEHVSEVSATFYADKVQELTAFVASGMSNTSECAKAMGYRGASDGTFKKIRALALGPDEMDEDAPPPDPAPTLYSPKRGQLALLADTDTEPSI